MRFCLSTLSPRGPEIVRGHRASEGIAPTEEANMDAKDPIPTAPSPPSPSPTAQPRRRQSRFFTYVILTGGVLTLLGVLGMQRHAKARAAVKPVAPVAVAPLPRMPEPVDPTLP